MNVLFLSESFYPHGSGAELATALYADLLSKSGYNVKILTNKLGAEKSVSKNGNFIIYRLPFFSTNSNVKYSILKRMDILFSNFFNEQLKWADVVYIPRFWFSAVPIVKARRKPVIMHLHDYIPTCPLSTQFDSKKDMFCHHHFCSPKCIYCFEKKANRSSKDVFASLALNSTLGMTLPKAMKLSDSIICVSNAQKNVVSAKDPSFTPKLSVIYNPLPDYSNIPTTGKDFGYFGGLNYLKGFQTLMTVARNFTSLSHQPLKIHCTKMNNLSNSFSDMLRLMGFNLYGKMEKIEYEALYRNIQTVLVPSLWPEPWPYVVVDALLQQRLLIASSVGGVPEQTEGCKGIFLSPPGDAKMLEKSISTVANLKKEVISDATSHNKEVILKKMRNEIALKRFCRIIDTVVSSPNN